MRRLLVASLGLALPTLGACKKTVDGPIPLCASEVEGGEAAETQSQNVPPEVWFTLILKNFNAKTGEPKRPATDCTNKPLEIEDEQVAQCVLSDDPVPALPPRPLDGEQDLEIIGIDDGQALVWVRTDYFEDGDALGPIAVAEFRSNGIAIRALGALRANPNRVRMRLEPMGESTVLVVESMVCPPDDPAKCARVMRVLPREGNRFVERPLLDDDDGCLGPATFAMTRSTEVTRDDGIIRRFELARTFDFEEGAVTVNEQVTIKDIDPEQPDAPPAVFRKAQIERPLRLEGGGLRTTQPLWERMMAEHGSVAVRSSEGEGQGGKQGEAGEAGGQGEAG
ncbi:MAG: hypothetical protein AAGF11_46815 [Myxococcota bacterium]